MQKNCFELEDVRREAAEEGKSIVDATDQLCYRKFRPFWNRCCGVEVDSADLGSIKVA